MAKATIVVLVFFSIIFLLVGFRLKWQTDRTLLESPPPQSFLKAKPLANE